MRLGFFSPSHASNPCRLGGSKVATELVTTCEELASVKSPDIQRVRISKQARLWEILGPLFGIAAVVLFVVGIADTFACVACEVDINDPPGRFARVFAETRQGTWLAAYLTLLGTFFLFGFLGYLRNELQRAEGDGGWLASVAYGVALVTGAVALMRVGLDLGMVTVADHGVNPEVARTLYVLGWNFDFAFAAPMAALVAATSTSILRYRWLPWPIGVLGVPVVIVILAWYRPGFGAGVAFLWLLILAVFMLWRSVREITRAGFWG